MTSTRFQSRNWVSAEASASSSTGLSQPTDLRRARTSSRLSAVSRRSLASAKAWRTATWSPDRSPLVNRNISGGTRTGSTHFPPWSPAGRATIGDLPDQQVGHPFLADGDVVLPHATREARVPRGGGHPAHPGSDRVGAERGQVLGRSHVPWCRSGTGHQVRRDANPLTVEVPVVEEAAPGVG